MRLCFIFQRCNNPERCVKCGHVKFREHGPKHLDDLHQLFDKFHITGASASCPGDVSSGEPSDDDISEVPHINDDMAEMKLSTLKKPKQTRKKRKIESAAEKITTSVEASAAPPQGNIVPTIAQAMKMVKECGVQEKTALMHTTSLMIMKPEFRELLSVLETNEGRFDLIERENEKEMKKAA